MWRKSVFTSFSEFNQNHLMKLLNGNWWIRTNYWSCFLPVKSLSVERISVHWITFRIELNLKNKLIESKNLYEKISFEMLLHKSSRDPRNAYQFSQSSNFDVFRINFRISIFHYLLVICIEFVAGVSYIQLRVACKSGCLVFRLQCICLHLLSFVASSFQIGCECIARHFNRHNEWAQREKMFINRVKNVTYHASNQSKFATYSLD